MNKFNLAFRIANLLFAFRGATLLRKAISPQRDDFVIYCIFVSAEKWGLTWEI